MQTQSPRNPFPHPEEEEEEPRASGCRRSRRWSVCRMGTLPRGSLYQLAPSVPGLKMLAAVLWPRAGCNSLNPLCSPRSLCLQLSVSIIPALSTYPPPPPKNSLIVTSLSFWPRSHGSPFPSFSWSVLSTPFPRNKPDAAVLPTLT